MLKPVKRLGMCLNWEGALGLTIAVTCCWTNLGLPEGEGALLVTGDPRDETRLYAAGESGAVYRSADGGKT